MKFHILSDLHLEFSNYMPPAFVDKADVIVLAGDIWKKDNGIAWARSTWPDHRIVYVAGNHEFYGKQRKDVLAMLRLAAAEYGVDFLDDDEVVIEKNGERVRILGATLWTDFELFGREQKKNAMFDGARALNDFRVIHEGEWHFSPQDSIDLHRRSVAFLQAKLDELFEGDTVVVTHHAPSWESVVPRYQKDLVSACFASRLEHLLDGSKVKLWIHGHMHDSLDYEVGGCRVLANPRGYTRFPGGEENDAFNPNLVIEVTKAGVKVVPAPRGVKTAKEKGLQMSARQRDAVIWAIDHLTVREHEGVKFVDLWGLHPDHRTQVRDVVLEHDRSLGNDRVPGHKAIFPLAVDDIEWLVEELIKRAPVTKRAPRRAKL